MSVDTVSHADFARTAGTTYTTRDGRVTFQLAEVSEERIANGWASFSLVFRTPSGASLEQATYALHHADLGDIDIFLVPIEPDANGARYQAVFTRRAGSHGEGA